MKIQTFTGILLHFLSIYDTIRAEVEGSKNETVWRNYDDINEYFWSKRCFDKLKWPVDVSSNFFVTNSECKHVGKTGFVEQRYFWNLFRSFDKLWIMLFLFLLAAIIVAWEEKEYLWHALEDREVQVKVLAVFFTWSSLRFFQSLLDVGMQYSLVSRETLGLRVRMVFKIGALLMQDGLLFLVCFMGGYGFKNNNFLDHYYQIAV